MVKLLETHVAYEKRKFEALLRERDQQLEEMQVRFEKMEKRFHEVLSFLRNPGPQQGALLRNGFGEGSGQGSHHNHTADSYGSTTRVGRVEFPQFGRTNFDDWLYRCQQFFEFEATPDFTKIRVIAIHLEGRALQWHQMWMKTRGVTGAMMGWDNYVAALSAHFSTKGYEDPWGDLKNLTQESMSPDYVEAFDSLLNRVEVVEEVEVSLLL